MENLAIAFIVGGGIGNMIDRVILGYVVDMIDFRLIDFAVFNVADSFVCVGAGLLMLYIILSGVQEYKEEKARKLRLSKWDDDEETSDEEGIAEDMPAEEMISEEAIAVDVSAEGLPSEEVPSENVFTEENPSEETSAVENPDEEETHA